MGGLKTIPKNTTTDANDGEHMPLEVHVLPNPYTKDLTPEVKAARAKLDAAIAEERGLRIAEAKAAAAVKLADQGG